MSVDNLARRAVDSLGRFEFAELAGPVAAAMPAHFLRSTLQLQPALAGHRSDIEELIGDLETPGRSWHRDPEIFGAITLLSQRAAAAAPVGPRLAALRLHMGRGEVAADELEEGPYRRVHGDGACYRAVGGRLERLPDSLVRSVGGLEARVLLPRPGLFLDLVEPRLYPSIDPRGEEEGGDGAEDGGEDGGGLAALAAAVALLAEVSPATLEDLQRVVRTVVLVPDLGDGERWSYNLRLAYFGAVFINPFPIGTAGMVESLVHEYLHQRLWQWWAYDPPSGLPSHQERLRSPVTGRDKPVPVMVHALVIYVAVQRILRAVLDAVPDLAAAERAGLEEREAKLRRAVPRLHRALISCLPPACGVSRLLDLAIDGVATGGYGG